MLLIFPPRLGTDYFLPYAAARRHRGQQVFSQQTTAGKPTRTSLDIIIVIDNTGNGFRPLLKR
jgi:hypothetical protein